jgi:hypothetical protein
MRFRHTNSNRFRPLSLILHPSSFILLHAVVVHHFGCDGRRGMRVLASAVVCAAAIGNGQPGAPSGVGVETLLRPGDRLQIELVRPEGDDDSAYLKVTGLNRSEWEALSEWGRGAAEWRKLFAVYVDADDPSRLPPMLGDYHVGPGVLEFRPRYPLRRGLAYRAIVDAAHLPGQREAARQTVTLAFSLPKPPSEARTRVLGVYPTGSTLPENLLKFYIHFSAPMSRGEAYQRIHLLDASGRRVEHPFLELGEELWDDSARRFTLLFDPGRIKRGLKPREDTGPALEAGKHYTLVIDREWPDAKGVPLGSVFRKPFQVVAPDRLQPDPALWLIEPPMVATRDALAVTFPEPLDHAMLQRVLAVTDSAGKLVGGMVTIDQEETRWRFSPHDAWQPGAYRLGVETVLEDRAGNSIGRPFEVDVFRPIERQAPSATVWLPFEISGPSE